jgi:hypothetical protein
VKTSASAGAHERVAHGDPDRTDVAATYVHNLTRTGKTTKRFERSAVNDKMPVSGAHSK